MSVLNFKLQLAGPVSPVFTPPLPVQQCHVSDEGVSLVAQVLDSSGSPVNLRMATLMKIITVRPSGVSVESDAEFFTNGLDGKMELVTGVSSPYGTGLDEMGAWAIQAKIKIGGNTQFTESSAFLVYGNLGA